MRTKLSIAAAVLLALALPGCVPGGPGSTTRPSLVVVREFAAPATIVVLDPSFGFSLNRGSPGVPQGQRAASVGRAVAFALADALTERLRQQGFDAVSTTDPAVEPAGRTLVVTGTFRHIDEGRRREVGAENASVVADVQAYYVAAGSQPRQALRLRLESQHFPPAPRPRDGNVVNAAAGQVGREIARSIIDLARRDAWLPAGR
jgi:hypothetical protein